MTDPTPAEPIQRHTVDTITSDALNALYHQLALLRFDKEGHDAVSQAWARKLGEQRARAERAEAELAALKSITSGYCGHCGRGDCSPTADQWLEQRQRADRAEAALERVRDLHRPVQGLGYDSDEDDTPGSYGLIEQACTTCGTTDEYAVRWPCPTIRALGEQQEQQP